MASYWDEYSRRRLTRRTAIRAGGLAAAGSAAIALIGCGDDNGAVTGAGATSTRIVPAEAPTQTAEQPVAGGSVTISGQYAAVFDPGIAAAGSTLTIEFAAYDKLNFIDAGFKLAPAMAELPQQPDAKTLIYKIKPNVFWHDKAPLNGRQFTAQDAAFGLQRFNQGNPQFIYRDRLARVEKFEAVDQSTLKLTLSQPFASMTASIADDPMVMVSRDAVEAFGDDAIAKDSLKIIGTGPYVMSKQDPNVETVLTKNPKYYRAGQPYFNEYRTIRATDNAAFLAAFVGGKTDFLNYIWNSGGQANWDAAQQQLGKDKVVKFDVPVTSTFAFQFNTQVKPYDDPRVRTALSLAVDRYQLVAIQKTAGIAAVIGGPLPAVMAPYGWSETDLAKRPGYRQGKDRVQDVKDAAAMLRASGADLTNLPKVTIPAGNLLIQAVQQNWKDIGFNVQIDEKPILDVLTARQAKNFSFLGQGLTGQSDPDLLYADTHSTGGQNYGSFSDPGNDALLDKGRSTIDANERKKIYDEVQDKLLTDLNPRIWWGHYQYAVIMKSDLRGFRPTPTLGGSPIMLAGMWRKA